MEWTTRPYKLGDEVGILSLLSLNSQQNERLTLEWWYWYHQKNPAGKAIILVAEADGKIVSHQCWIPLRIKVFSKTTVAGRSGDSKTHPDYRRQGIFNKLLSEGYDLAMKQKWSFYIGLPNELSRPALIKSGWIEVCQIAKWMNVLNLDSVTKIIRKEHGILIGTAVNLISKFSFLKSLASFRNFKKNNLNIEIEHNIDERYDNFWNAISQYLKIALICDKEYLNWRYYNNPAHKYTIYCARNGDQILGFTVLACYKEKYNIGRILEFFAFPNRLDVSEALLCKAKYFFKNNNMDLIQCMAKNNLLPRKIALKQGFISSPIRKANFFVFPITKRIKTDILGSRDNWFTSFGVLGSL